MLSTLRKPAAQETLKNEPTVVFDAANSVVTLSVIVAPTRDGNDFSIAVAPASIPRGSWTLVWILVPLSGLQAQFGDPGIIVDTKPPRVKFSAFPVSGQEWRATVENDVIDVNVVHYSVDVEAVVSADGQRLRRKIKDPTVAVTNDPPPGG